MLKETIERFRDYFYEYPGNPVELSDTEEEIREIIPGRDDVVEGGQDPITTRELQEEAHERFDMRKDTARKSAYKLKDKGVADKYSKKEWVKTGRFKKLSESKLKNLFITISILFLGLSFVGRNPWPLYMATTLLVISIALFW